MDPHVILYLGLSKAEKLEHLKSVMVKEALTTDAQQQEYCKNFIKKVSIFDQSLWDEFLSQKLEDFHIYFNSRDEGRLYEQNMEIVEEIEDIQRVIKGDGNQLIHFMRYLAMVLKGAPEEPEDKGERCKLWQYMGIYGAISKEIERRNLKSDIIPKVIYIKKF